MIRIILAIYSLMLLFIGIELHYSNEEEFPFLMISALLFGIVTGITLCSGGIVDKKMNRLKCL